MELQAVASFRAGVPEGRARLWTQAFLLAAPALLLALVTIPYRYDVTLSEPDLVRMMAALVYGGATGAEEAAGMHYGLKFSFGYYKLLYAIAPEDWLRDPDLAAQLMNGLGIASAMLCALACNLYLRTIFGLTVAAATSAMFFLSPATLPLALSGHPLVPAAACLFAAGWLLAKGEARGGGWPAWALCVAALAALVLGLSLRAEVVLAFPFLWLAAPAAGAGGGRSWTVYAAKALLLGAAFALLLVLQRPYVSADGGAAESAWSFAQAFMSASRMGRGAVVLTLAAGAATVLLVLIAATRSRYRQREFYLPLILGLPALLLWLPNPQPARHFFFVLLACCLFVVLWLEARQWKPAQLLAISLLTAFLNQVVAEIVRPVIVSRYAWSYPSVTERRATQQAPIGAFPLDQRANQALASAERREAVALARQAPQRLVILADFQHYLIAHLVAADHALKWRDTRWDGFGITELRSAARHIVLIERYRAWPRDLVGSVVEDERWRGWPIYVQPSTVSRFDKTMIPAQRRYELPEGPP